MIRKNKGVLTRAFFHFDGIECRSENDKTTITGYAAVFEKLSVQLSWFQEKIRRGAFAESLKTNSIKALWNHNDDIILGSSKSGTLRLQEDAVGLRFELDPPDTQAGRDAVVTLKRGDVEGMSFGFIVRKQEWDETNPKNVIRTLIDVDLHEISITGFPAYPDTSVQVRTIIDDYKDFVSVRGEAEKVLIDKNKANIDIFNKKFILLDKEIV